MLRFDQIAQLRVPTTSGRTRVGSGLLLTERLVLTAAHCVEGAGDATAIEVLFPFADARAVGTVAWRGNAGLDVALLELEKAPGGAVPLRVPVVRWGRLTGQRPGVPVTGVGFPRVLKDAESSERVPDQVDGTINPGTGSGRRYDVSLTGPYPLAAADDPSPWAGLSGAALFSSGLLIGVVVIDTPSFQSGRLTAVPAWRLVTDPGCREVLTRHGCGHVWESVELASLFERRTRRVDSPAALLRSDIAVVRFRGRADVLAGLRAWCSDGATDVAARVVAGPGGQGKTRLAQQLCADLCDAGWVAGFAREDANDDAMARLRDSELPVLVICDYAETRAAQLRRLAEAAGEPTRAVRLLLLARSAGEWWQRLVPQLRRTVRVERAPLQLAGLEQGLGGREDAYGEAVVDLSAMLPAVPGHSDGDWRALAGQLASPDLSAPAFTSILMIQLQALIDLLSQRAMSDDAPHAEPEDLEAVLLEHEQLYWDETAARRGLVEPAFQPDTLKCAVAAATLVGAVDEAEALATVCRLPSLDDKSREERRGVARWLADLYPSSEARYWGALEPDRIGEYLVGAVERTRPGLIATILDDASEFQYRRAFVVMVRAMTRQPDLLHAVTPVLAEKARDLFRVAARESDLGFAEVAAIVATRAWLQLDDRKKAIVNYIDWLQTRYMLAETPDAYADVRGALMKAVEIADRIGERREAFKAATLAADCSYWASQASTHDVRNRMLLQTLRDLLSAADHADLEPDVNFERYVSLLAATVEAAMATAWSTSQDAEPALLLKAVAAAVDRTVPTDFAFRHFGDAEKTDRTREVLAALVFEHGD